MCATSPTSPSSFTAPASVATSALAPLFQATSTTAVATSASPPPPPSPSQLPRRRPRSPAIVTIATPRHPPPRSTTNAATRGCSNRRPFKKNPTPPPVVIQRPTGAYFSNRAHSTAQAPPFQYRRLFGQPSHARFNNRARFNTTAPISTTVPPFDTTAPLLT